MNKRLIALSNHQSTYSTGQPCRKGHTSERYASNGMCMQCLKDRSKITSTAVKKARAERFIKEASGFDVYNVMVQRRHNTSIKHFNDLMASPDADAFATWLWMMSEKPLDAATLTMLLDYRDGIAHGYTQYETRHDEAGYLRIRLRDAWYVADEVMATIRGERETCTRVME